MVFDYANVTRHRDDPGGCTREVAIVLGAAQYDGVPSPAFERRLRVAADAYAAGCIAHVVVTGGAREGDRSTEGDSGAAWLMRNGVARSDVTAETTSRSTVENLRNARLLIASNEALIITDDLHAHRAAWIAQRLGMDTDTLTATVPPPRITYALRETVALQRYRWFGLP